MTVNIGLLNAALDFVSDTTISGVFWGINLSLYFLCTQLFFRRYREAPDERKNLITTFLCNSVVVFMAGLELSTNTRVMQLTFINHGGVHGEPLEFLASIKMTSAIALINILPFFVIPVLNSLVQLRRIWVIWEMSPYKFIVTFFLLMLEITAEAIQIYYLTIPTTPTPAELKMKAIFETAQIATSLAFNLLVTLLLVGRIVIMRRRHNRLLGITSEHAKQYTSVVAILIESFALDSIWETAATITFALFAAGVPVRVFNIFNDTGDQVTVIAFLLVSYRVLLKRAWTPETGRQLSTLQWRRDDPEGMTTDQTTLPGYLPPTIISSRLVAGENASPA